MIGPPNERNRPGEGGSEMTTAVGGEPKADSTAAPASRLGVYSEVICAALMALSYPATSRTLTHCRARLHPWRRIYGVLPDWLAACDDLLHRLSVARRRADARERRKHVPGTRRGGAA